MVLSLSANIFMLLIQLAAIMVFMSAGVASAAEAISFTASGPYTMYHTTNGAEVSAPVSAAPEMFYQTKPESPETVENKQKNTELINRLQKKYDLDRDNLTIRLEHTQYGPKGHINLVRKVLPKDVASRNNSTGIDENNHSSVNAIVLEFLTEEAELFGIKNLDEWRETSFVTDGLDFTMIEFQRYIDQLPLENSFIKFFVSSTGQISSVSAQLMPASPELYLAAKKDTLTEERIRAIAEETLLRMGFDANTDLSGRKAEKIALSTPPYVLWKVESKGTIFIDAFTGEVLIKLSGTKR